MHVTVPCIGTVTESIAFNLRLACIHILTLTDLQPVAAPLLYNSRIYVRKCRLFVSLHVTMHDEIGVYRKMADL